MILKTIHCLNTNEFRLVGIPNMSDGYGGFIITPSNFPAEVSMPEHIQQSYTKNIVLKLFIKTYT